MDLPLEIEKFKNECMPLYWNVPPRIIRMWNTHIEPTNLYGSGEKGAYAFAASRPRLSRDSLIYLAVYADSKGHPEMANGFWKLATEKSKYSDQPTLPKSKNARSHMGQKGADPKIPKETLSLQEWLFTLVRRQGNHSCYSIFLVLPSDREAIRYLEEFSAELKAISNATNCLVIALGSGQHLRFDVDGENWSSRIKNDIQKGYSVKIGRLFGLDFTQFPCLVVFRNLNSSENILVTLKGMTAEEIAEKMKSVFSIIQRATEHRKSPIEELHRHRNDERLRHAGKSLITGVGKLVDKTFQAIIEVLIEMQLSNR